MANDGTRCACGDPSCERWYDDGSAPRMPDGETLLAIAARVTILASGVESVTDAGGA
jgi:hypothetical protein